MSDSQSFWKKCSNCKKEIPFQVPYQRCSVTTCNHERTGMQFCSVSCWSSHVPIYRHRDAWAIEETSPSKSQSVLNEAMLAKAIPTPVERVSPSVYVSQGAAPRAPQASFNASTNREVLVVVSKLKSYIKDRADMNTSADVMEELSDLLRLVCDEAISHARSDGRKTVMARDFVSKRK